MEAFVLFLLVMFAVVNLVIAIGASMLLIKIFEILKIQESRHQLEEDAKVRARGLIDIDTPQAPYNLRTR